MARKLFKTFLNQALADYLKGDRIPEIAKRYGFNRATVWQQLSKITTIRPDNQTHAQRYTLNENYFDIIDTEGKAYYLGLMLADGSNNEEKHNIRINLQEGDKSILESFLLELKTNNTLKFVDCSNQVNRKNQWRVDIYNKHMSKELEKYGCIYNKEFSTYFPTQIPEELYNHFIRGYFDGDGSICNNFKSKKTTHKSTFWFSLTGNILLLDSIQNVLVKELGLSKVKMSTRYPKKQNTTRQFAYGGNEQCIKIRDWLYKDANFYIQRKFDEFNQINTI